jgi:hypothetical protein
MFCEYEVFSFCTLMPLSVISFMVWNYEFIIKSLTYGADIGNVRFTKRSLDVETTQGGLSIPVLTLPSYDWSVGFFVDDSSTVTDGFNDWNVIEKHEVLNCNIVRNKLICEYMYPHQITGKLQVRGFVGSMFDSECYVFTVEKDQPIDYQKYCNELADHLEDL